MKRPIRCGIATLTTTATLAVAIVVDAGGRVGTVPLPGPVPVATVPEPDLPEVAADAGAVAVVAATDPDRAVTEGDSQSVFSLRLPAGAECPGDSANDGWRVQTFIVPSDVDPATLVYGGTRPRGEGRYALYSVEGRPYVQILLAQNPSPGLPGQILGFPPLSFAPFTPDLLPEGRYRIGVACSYFEIGARYWDAELEFTADPDVEPGERRWSVVDASPSLAESKPESGSGSSTDRVILVVGAGIVLAAAAAMLMRAVSKPQRRTT